MFIYYLQVVTIKMAQALQDRLNALAREGIYVQECEGGIEEVCKSLQIPLSIRTRQRTFLYRFPGGEGNETVVGWFSSGEKNASHMQSFINSAVQYAGKLIKPDEPDPEGLLIDLRRLAVELHAIEDFQHNKVYLFGLPDRRYLKSD